MSSSDANEALLQPNEDQEAEVRIDVRHVMCNMMQSKALQILKSAVAIFTCNIKLMLFMMLSIFPLFVFMVLFEIKLQKLVVASPESPESLAMRSSVRLSYAISNTNVSSSNRTPTLIVRDYYSKQSDEIMEFFSDVIQLCILYLVVHPVLELFSMTVTMKTAAKVSAGEKQVNFKEVFYEQINLKGPSITYLYVHLLSSLNLLGIYWVVENHLLFSNRFSSFVYSGYDIWSIEFCMRILSIVLHSAIFVALVYKYLGWSAFWNMTLVISVLGEEAGIGAFGMCEYYGKRCRPTGFQLMLGFVAFSTLLRLPCVYAGLCNASVAGISVTCGVIGLVCLSYLVKWVAFVLYFQDCKQQTMEKKIDEELGESKAAE